MPSPVVRASPVAQEALRPALEAVRLEHEVPTGFPSEVLAEADAAALSADVSSLPVVDLPFVTIDPLGSTDLDQALHLQARPGGGWRVCYAIADLAAFVPPSGAVAGEAWSRVFTVYCPDRRIPLHPSVISEQAASLWPDGDRPAIVWTIDLDEYGETVAVDVRRGLVRSRAKLDYADVQQRIDDGTAGEMLALLPDVGRVLSDAQLARGGASLPIPDQQVVEDTDGYRLVYRLPLPVEDWNAQLSLLTGRAAARLMLDGGMGVLRSMPAASQKDEQRLRRVAHALQIEWPDDMPYGQMVNRLGPPLSSRTAAFLTEATSLFRGAAYQAFDGSPPAQVEHAAIAAPYTHCTAPIRRLVDRFSSQVCLAISAGSAIPDWVRAALPLLPERMSAGGRRVRAIERESLDAVEAAVLRPLAGQHLAATVTEVRDESRGEVAVADPAVIAPCSGSLTLGEQVLVHLDEQALAQGRVRLVAVSG